MEEGFSDRIVQRNPVHDMYFEISFLALLDQEVVDKVPESLFREKGLLYSTFSFYGFILVSDVWQDAIFNLLLGVRCSIGCKFS